MKLCTNCKSAFATSGWQCPSCGFEPSRIDGFLSFAPQFAEENDGFAASDHDSLDRSQAGSFWFRARNRLIRDLVLMFFSQATSVFEVGCGTGYVLECLCKTIPSAELTGSEIHIRGLRYAERRVASTLHQMDARMLPFKDEFDLICAFDVLEHIEEDETVLKEMARSLRPKGGLLLSVPQHPSLWSFADNLAQHKRRYQRGELERKCEANGFKIVRTTSFVFSLLPLMAVQRITNGRKTDYDPASELKLPVWLDRFFDGLLDVERYLIKAGVRLPVGGSRFVVAQKKSDLE